MFAAGRLLFSRTGYPTCQPLLTCQSGSIVKRRMSRFGAFTLESRFPLPLSDFPRDRICVTASPTAKRIKQLVEQGAINALSQMLDRADAKVTFRGPFYFD